MAIFSRTLVGAFQKYIPARGSCRPGVRKASYFPVRSQTAPTMQSIISVCDGSAKRHRQSFLIPVLAMPQNIVRLQIEKLEAFREGMSALIVRSALIGQHISCQSPVINSCKDHDQTFLSNGLIAVPSWCSFNAVGSEVVFL
jgi:hypothetical protein